MILTDKQLQLIEEYSGLFLNPEEIAVLLDIDRIEFCYEIAQKISPAYDKYLIGRTNKKKEIRENVIKLATKGSPQAQELAEKYIKEQHTEERKNVRKTSD